MSAGVSDSSLSVSALYGLPVDVKFCPRCVISNQRPMSTVEFQNKNVKETIQFDDDGVCSACAYHEFKWTEIDWAKRHDEFLTLLDKHRSGDGSYDVIVPGSGGKDSTYVSHILKYKYGMNPLTVTWAPHVYTEIGRKNFDAWINSGMDNICFTSNSDVHRRLTREAFVNLLHPFQPFILGQKQIGPKLAYKFGVKLVMYGESQAEGGTHLHEAFNPVQDPKYYAVDETQRTDVHLGGRSYSDLLSDGYTKACLEPYLPITLEEIGQSDIEVHHMGYYEQWIPQEKFYYAAENCGFQPNPERTEGTYSKYISLDDKMDGLHYFTTYIKFGIGRASYEAAQEIRNKHINREEGVALVRRYDGEFPKKYFLEILDYLNISEEQFWNLINEGRSPHLWELEDDGWRLRHKVE